MDCLTVEAAEFLGVTEISNGFVKNRFANDWISLEKVAEKQRLTSFR